jgi:hypothetical protein
MIRSLQANLERAPTVRRRWMLLGILWLNVVTAPCAMAFGDDHGCIHAAEGHGQHAGGHAHHDPAPAADCADAECCDSPDAALDVRQGKSDGDDSDDVAAIAAYTALDSSACVHTVSTERPPPDRLYLSPAINVLNCVYLD